MGITVSNKTLSKMEIECGGTFNVQLSLAAAPDIVENPVDIVLILDRSGSMAGTPLANLKLGAKSFIDIIDEATDPSGDGQIGGGSRIGIVSFSSTATQDTQLITDVNELKTTVDELTASGQTNHADAFTNAQALFDPSSSNARVMVMFTDGETTVGGDPSPIAEAARAAGTVIYCIGLIGSGGVDVDALEDWASKPASSYVVVTPDDTELEELFENLARNITKPGATNIVLEDTVSPCFRITGLSSPTKGSASILSETTVRWTIDKLGESGSEGAELRFSVQHVGTCSGSTEVNERIDYSDNENNAVAFPSPELEINCGTDIIPEGCPIPISFSICGCEDSVEFDAGDIGMASLGKILQLDVTIQNACPNKRIALAAMLSEVDESGEEYSRGMKTIVVPAHTRPTCSDVTVRCIKFVLPEELNVSGGSSNSPCGCRNLRVRFIAHYIDSDFECCKLTI